MPWVYMLRCRDDTIYVGMTVNLDLRVAQHHDGTFGGYTAARRPVTQIWRQATQTDDEAFQLERRLKAWSRPK